MNSEDPIKQRVLGLDIGSKRIGLALWEPASKLTRPLEVRQRKSLKEDLRYFEELFKKENIEALVVGLPITLSGQISSSTETALFWIDQFNTHFKLPVYSFDESLTTKEAFRIMEGESLETKKKKKDSIAAALILEGFMQDAQARNTRNK